MRVSACLMLLVRGKLGPRAELLNQGTLIELFNTLFLFGTMTEFSEIRDIP